MKTLLKSTLVLIAGFCLPAFSFSAEIEELRTAIEQSDWAEAKALGESVTSADSENGEAFQLLGKALVGLKENEAAAAALKRANELVSDNADYLADYAYALILRGQEMNMFQAGPTYMKAMDQYKQAVQIDPDHLASHIGLARYYMHAPAIGGGSMKKALEHAAEIARLNPFQGHVHNAMIAEKQGRSADSESEYAAAIALKGDQAWLHFNLAKLQQAAGKTAEARASFEKTLELNPKHKGAKSALAAWVE